MIFGNPVNGRIYLSPGLVDGRPRWFRSQAFGCTGFGWEPPLGSCDHFHRANDIARGPAGCGDDMIATQSGVVFYAGLLTDGAKVVNIRHADGFATGHGHMASLSVAKGQHVVKGEKIGTVGESGNATGCHDHQACKNGFPASAGVNEFWRDGSQGGEGHWIDIWPLLEQNVTIHPNSVDGIRIRSSASTSGTPFATVESGRIIRESDHGDLGSASTWHGWGGAVVGASYTVGSVTSKVWDKLYLDGAFRYIARPLAVRSAS